MLENILCASPTACQVRELDDWKCSQSFSVDGTGVTWGVIRYAYPSNFILTSSSSIGCNQLDTYVIRNGVTYQHRPMISSAVGGGGCMTNWTFPSPNVEPYSSVFYDLAISFPSSEGESTLTRVAPYARLTMEDETYTVTSQKLLVHNFTLRLPPPSFSCCTGYTASAIAEEETICNRTRTTRYSRTYFPVSQIQNHSTIDYTYILPAQACLWNAYEYHHSASEETVSAPTPPIILLTETRSPSSSGTVTASAPPPDDQLLWIIPICVFFGLVLLAFLIFLLHRSCEKKKRVEEEDMETMAFIPPPSPLPVHHYPRRRSINQKSVGS
jgi:hypothetical protein